MKKASLLLLFAVISLSSYAQYQPDRIKLGLKAGFNLSLFTKDVGLFTDRSAPYQDFNRTVRGSFTGGVTMDIKMAKGFSFSTELLYSGRGMTYQEENLNFIETDENGYDRKVYNYFNYNLDYLELPIILNYNFKQESSKKELMAYLGLSQAVLVNHTTKLKYPRKDREHEDQKATLENVHKYNKNLIAGLKFGEKEAFGVDAYLDLRGSYTLSPVFNKPRDSDGNNLSTRMWTIALTFGVKF